MTILQPGQISAVRWHRYAECATDMDMVPLEKELIEVAKRHGHEYTLIRSGYEAREEVRHARARIARIEEAGASSYAALGYRERHLYLPMMNVGMFEGEVFDLFELGAQSGVRVVFIGPRSRFEIMPYRLMINTDDSGVLCGCEQGF